MTLILAAHVGGHFAVTTADTRQTHKITEIKLNGEVNTYGPIQEIKEVQNKAIFLTENVMFAGAGQSCIIEYIREKLIEMTSESSGLELAAYHLQLIIESIRERNAKMKDDFKKDDLYFLHAIEGDDTFAVVLNGFCEDDSCGFAYFISGQKETVFIDAEEDEYQYLMWSPSLHYTEQKEKFFDMDIRRDDLDVLVNQMAKVHTIISYLEPDYVSPTFKCKVLKRKQNSGKIKQKEKVIETNQWYEELGLNKK